MPINIDCLCDCNANANTIKCEPCWITRTLVQTPLRTFRCEHTLTLKWQRVCPERFSVWSEVRFCILFHFSSSPECDVLYICNTGGQKEATDVHSPASSSLVGLLPHTYTNTGLTCAHTIQHLSEHLISLSYSRLTAGNCSSNIAFFSPLRVGFCAVG